MIVYQLACAHDHFFEGWFASPQACDAQAAAGRLECPVCASSAVRKLPAAPHVHTSGNGAPALAPAPIDEGRLRAMVRAEAASLVRKFILANTENVGREFPEVARRIHYREEDSRGIRGQVTPAEARELHEEGIETYTVAPEVFASDEVH
jgi:hypothetical protein